MKRDEFLSVLRGLLAELPEDEIEQAVRYYEEYLDEAEDEETALTQLGSPKQIAERILVDVERQEPKQDMLQGISAEEHKAVKQHDPWRIAGIVLLCICASPLLLSLGAVALSIAACLLAVVLSALAAILAPAISVSLGLLAASGLLFYAAAGAMGIFTPGAVLMIGMGLLLGALGILSSLGTAHLLRGIWLLIKKLFLSLTGKKGAKQA